MDTPQPTVFVVDDDQAVRKSLELLIRSVNLNVATFASAQDFLAKYDDQRAGCLIVDIRMPGMSGLELQRCLVERGAHPPIIIITGHGDVPIAVRAMKDGAMEFLEKPFSKQLLLEHVRAAMQRDAQQRSRSHREADIHSRLGALTPRERQVMELVVAGKASKEVANELKISKKTVDVHRGRVMQKMKADSLAELVQMVLSGRPADTPARS